MDALKRRPAAQPQLIVGHTTHNSVKIWVRGDMVNRYARVEISADSEDSANTYDNTNLQQFNEVRELNAETDYTGVFHFEGLSQNLTYRVVAQFGSSIVDTETRSRNRHLHIVHGRFRTFPIENEQCEFSFLHGSCNLSIVSISNTIALAVGAAGTSMVRSSLRRPPTPTGRFKHLKRLLFQWRIYALVEYLTKLLFAISLSLTGWLKQPDEPRFRSPFLRISSVLGTWRLSFEAGVAEPTLGSTITGADSKATGLALKYPNIRQGSWAEGNAQGELQLVQVNGVFEPGEQLMFDSKPGARATGFLQDPRQKDSPPAFMFHAGDQIYFDFPFTHRRPTLEEYRMAYREAWSEDRPAMGFLAQCPQYMMLDDHEIVDQYDAADIGAHKYSTVQYLQPARQAYREYVHCRHPINNQDSLYYNFQYGDVHFFVMDTRTERCGGSGRMISREQLDDFKLWLAERSSALKFVVSSVPFVGELRVNEERDDKWCGERYRCQREEIIDFIASERIRRLVFLVGDMHCCYHATMDIDSGPVQTSRDIQEHSHIPGCDIRPRAHEVHWQVVRTLGGSDTTDGSEDLDKNRTLSGRIAFWQCDQEREIGAANTARVHELGAGPIHQLQLSRRDQFHRLYQAETDGGARFRVELRQFDSGAAAIMKLGIRHVNAQ